MVYYILQEDIGSSSMGTLIEGTLLNSEQMSRLAGEVQSVGAWCFASEAAALEWNACQ